MISTPERREHLYELLKDFDTAMLLTRTSDGHMHGRPMAVAELRPGADVLFATRLDSPKISEISENAEATLTFQSARQFASLCGHVSVVRDRALIDRVWKEAWKVWFPEGRSDPSLALLKFDTSHGEYWDNAGAQGLKYAMQAAKAYVKGQTPKTDDAQHAKVNL